MYGSGDAASAMEVYYLMEKKLKKEIRISKKSSFPAAYTTGLEKALRILKEVHKEVGDC
jgi:hypothetical protein